jgi:hypothetical protein
MGRAIDLRPDFGSAELRRLAKREKGGDQARRLLALAAVYDGLSREEADGWAAWTVKPCATG